MLINIDWVGWLSIGMGAVLVALAVLGLIDKYKERRRDKE